MTAPCLLSLLIVCLVKQRTANRDAGIVIDVTFFFFSAASLSESGSGNAEEERVPSSFK